MRVPPFDAREMANQPEASTGSHRTCSSVPRAKNSVQLPLIILNKICRAEPFSITVSAVPSGTTMLEQSTTPLSQQEPIRISFTVSSGLDKGRSVLFLRRNWGSWYSQSQKFLSLYV